VSPHHRTQRPSIRRTATGIIGAIAIGLVAMSPVAHVSAADGSGALVFGARLCPTVAASENFTYECDPIDPGAVTFVTWDGVTTLGMDSAVNANGILNWHAPNINVPLTDYHVDVTGLAVPDGYELWNIVPGQGEGGGSEFGWYASLTDESPETDLYALYVPDGGPDSDGDGASDSSEIAFGSDPYDPSSYPEVQAGPEGGPSAGPSDADDSDGDGVGDLTETNADTDPYDACSFPDLDPLHGPSAGPSDCDDSDGDGAGDWTEANAGTDPGDPTSFPSVQAGPEPGETTNGDADGDAVSDLDEINIYGTDPNSADTDGDGAPDYDEIWAGVDPLDPSSFPSVQAGPEGGPSAGPSDADDSDGDGAGDLTETNADTDPYDASSFPAVQAGPEPATSTGTSGGSATTVLRLPNTGSGDANAPASFGTGLLQVFGSLCAAITFLGGVVGIHRRA